MNSLQAEGSDSNRSVCPVGAVSNTTWSKAVGGAGVAQQLGELVEGGDLDGAGARELLLHAGDRRGRAGRRGRAPTIRSR